nr:unnamed protein product [Naegleria fowleri]
MENNLIDQNHEELLEQRSATTRTIVKSQQDDISRFERNVGVTFVMPHDLSIIAPSMNQDVFEQFSHQSLLSWNWNSKVDHTESVFSMMQYYYGPFKLFLLFMAVLIFTTICMVSLVKVSSLGKQIENTLFESVRSEALKISHSGTVMSMLKTAPAIKTIIYLTLFLIVTILIILLISIFVTRLILKFVRRRVLQKFEKIKKAFNIEAPPPREKLDFVLYDDNYNGSAEEKLSEAIYGYVQLSKRLIIATSNSSIISQSSHDKKQATSSSQELSISNFVLEHMMKSMLNSQNSSSPSSESSITTSSSLLQHNAILEIEHFLLKEQIPTFSKPHEYHLSNFSIAQEFLLLALAMARKDVKFKNCGFVLIRVPSVQYGMMRLCENLGFTLNPNMPRNDKNEETFTFAVCGGGAVGKSSITIRWTQDTFIEIYDPTIEATFNIARKIDNQTTYLTIIDTAGQDEFSALQDVYMRNAYGFVLVFDCTSKASLEELQKYTERVYRIKSEEYKQVDGKDYPVIFVGNKYDLVQENPKGKYMTEKEIKEFIKTQLGLPEKTPFLFASAKNGLNMKEALESIVREMREFEKGQKPVTNPMKPPKSPRKGMLSSVSDKGEVQSDLERMKNY